MRKTAMAMVATLVGGGVSVALAAPALANEPCGTTSVSTDEQYAALFTTSPANDTRATGHYDLVPEGLRLWTEGATSTDKVTGYRDLTNPITLGSQDEQSDYDLGYTNTSGGGVPGYQLIIDFGTSATDDTPDGTPDGILIGEEIYGADWWLNNAAPQWVKDRAPSHAGGSGSDNHGTLPQWHAAFPEAEIMSFGFSLGSGVKGDFLLDQLKFGCTTYVFAEEEPQPPANVAPEASFFYWNSGDSNYRTFTVNANGSSDSDGTIVRYRWNFGDGTTGSGKALKHTFPATSGRTYTVTLTITDDDGATDTFQRRITVRR